MPAETARQSFVTILLFVTLDIDKYVDITSAGVYEYHVSDTITSFNIIYSGS